MQRLADTIQLKYYNEKRKVFAVFSPSEGIDTDKVCNEVSSILGETISVKVINGSEVGSLGLIKTAGETEIESEKYGADLVLVDCGGVFSDKIPLSFFNNIDAGILVVKAGKTRRAMVAESIEWLQRHNIELIGTVLLGVRRVIPNFIYRLVF